MGFITLIPVIVILLTLAAGKLVPPPYSKTKAGLGEGGPGKPLFLSPLLEREEQDIDTVKKLARVTSEDICVESYAGYFTVNKTYDCNLFFWFFPAREQSDTAPVLVWLQGGPGRSSLTGLFMQNGPLQVSNKTIKEREHHWAITHNIIYIDSLVGAGFSFTKDPKGYSTTQIEVAENLYSAMKQFFQLFPELQHNDFFVTGDAYGGKFAAALAYTIHKENPSAKLKINLTGISIGSCMCDPEHQLTGNSQFLYHVGLVDANQALIVEESENKAVNFIKEGKYDDAYRAFNDIINMFGGIGTNCLFCNLTGFKNLYNILHTKRSVVDKQYRPVIKKANVRQSIHVGNMKFDEGLEAHRHMRGDIMNSVAPWVSELLDHYKVLVYGGQLDFMIPYASIVEFLKHLKFSGSENYATEKRHIWRVDGEVAGYIKRTGKLWEVLVRNAGHLVAADQPKWALEMITAFTHKK